MNVVGMYCQSRLRMQQDCDTRSAAPSRNKKARDRAVSVIEYVATVPEFFVAINAYVSANPSMLDTTLSFLLHNRRLLDFANKQAYFMRRVRESSGYHYSDHTQLWVDRNMLLETAVEALLGMTSEEVRCPHLSIQFEGEAGVGTGPVREFFDITCAALLSPDAGVFEPTPDGSAYHPKGGVLPRLQAQRAEALGRLIGLAMRKKIYINVRLTKAMAKFILALSVGFDDLEDAFPDLHK
jgi:E3 ubiquitin-protein ligase HUWE1